MSDDLRRCKSCGYDALLDKDGFCHDCWDPEDR